MGCATCWEKKIKRQNISCEVCGTEILKNRGGFLVREELILDPVCSGGGLNQDFTGRAAGSIHPDFLKTMSWALEVYEP